MSPKYILILILGAAILAGCSLVDEDLSLCDTEYGLDYELRMVTNLSTELSTQLSMTSDITIASQLRTYLKDVFTDFAHDVDLGFYDDTGDSLRIHRETHIMDANQQSYTLNIPKRRYMHLAIANISENGLIALESGDSCHTARLMQKTADTIGNHKTGLFTARLPMDIVEGENQSFEVKLYMANCATSLVLDTLGSSIRDIEVFATGFATGFKICDSTFIYGRSPIVRAEEVETGDDGTMCFSTINFPSKDLIGTKAVIETEEPFVSDEAEGSLWEYHIYCTTRDGTVTRSFLHVHKPLRAGQYKILRVRVLQSGAADTTDPTVGVNVTLDWSQGPSHNVEF